MNALPAEAEATLAARWPHILGLDFVKHSDECYSVVLLDVDYKHYTFNLSLSLDGRWTVVPIAGFHYAAEGQLDVEDFGWQVSPE